MADVLRASLDLPRRGFRLSAALAVGSETVALVGPSGSGKTSVLHAVAGLVRPRGGRITLGDEVWFDADAGVDRPPDRRSVGLVFQDHALFPHMTVEANVAFGGPARARELMERLGIAHLAAARPGTLSGGERQRVAVARALARGPRVLLLDEPMAALDAHTRARVRTELRGLLAEFGLPTILVSHDFADAAALASRVAVVDRGAIVQEGTPDDLVARPASAFVAALTGVNLLPGTAAPAAGGGTEVLLDSGHAIRTPERLAGRVGLVVHPARTEVARPGGQHGRADPGAAVTVLTGVVEAVVPLGPVVRVQIGGVTAEVAAARWSASGLGEGAAAAVGVRSADARLVPLTAPDPAGAIGETENRN